MRRCSTSCRTGHPAKRRAIAFWSTTRRPFTASTRLSRKGGPRPRHAAASLSACGAGYPRCRCAWTLSRPGYIQLRSPRAALVKRRSASMSNVNPNPFTTRPEIEGTFGVVTSTQWIATAVGMGVLEKGGNAFDAAVATAFTLQVVEPHLNGPGGDAPVILHDTRKGG